MIIKSLGIQHPQTATIIVEIPNDGGIGSAFRIVSFTFSVCVRCNVEIFRELDVLRS